MRFLADENVSRLVIDRLRANGFEDCVLITEDRDFGELVIRQRLGVRGVILLELDRLSNTAEAEAVVQVVSIHAENLIGHLVVVEPGRVRLRPLPG